METNRLGLFYEGDALPTEGEPLFASGLKRERYDYLASG